jgi:chemotaxis protein histidine kinase CheA
VHASEITIVARPHATRARSKRLLSRDEDLIARAEAAVQQLSTHFAGWMRDECTRLEGLLQRVAESPSDPDLRDQLFRAAHDIEGQASTFGYPLAERVAISLCLLGSGADERAHVPHALIARHVAALRKALHPEHSVEVLAAELERAVAEFRETRGASDCPTIKGPPLAPGI